MEQYIIISGTNRKDSNTYKVALQYQKALEEKNIRATLLSLEDLDLSSRNDAYKKMEEESRIPNPKLIFISTQ